MALVLADDDAAGVVEAGREVETETAEPEDEGRGVLLAATVLLLGREDDSEDTATEEEAEAVVP